MDKEARGEEKAGRKNRRHTPVALPLVSQAGIRARKSWRVAFPGWTQWHDDAPALAYRCGGSSGL